VASASDIVGRARAALDRGDAFAAWDIAAEDDGSPVRGRLAWKDVEIHAGAGLVTWPGLADGPSVDSDGVVFEVWVDGQLLESRTVLAGTARRGWQVDLRAFAGRRAAIQLAVDPRGDAAGDAALWGRPVIVFGYDRPPLEVLAEER